jgi:DNA mismatch repair protein MutS2
MAAEEAEALAPSFQPDAVWEELARTQEAHGFLAHVSAPSLGAVRDVRHALERANKGGSLGGSELYQVGETIAAMRAFKAVVKGRQHEYKTIWEHATQLADLQLLESQLFASLDGAGEVKDSAGAELAGLRRKKHSALSRIQERIQSYTAGKFREMLSDPIYTVRDGRYVVPVKVENRGKIRGIVHDTSGSGQTLFIEPEEVLQLGNSLRELEAAEREEVRRVLFELSSKVGKSAPDIMPGIEAAAAIDYLLAKGRLGYEMKGVMPQKWQGVGINIHSGRHPLLARDVAVPIDVTVGFDYEGLLITGPNTGGKTVAIKTIGLYVAMLQSGLFVPAVDVKFGPFSQIWADIGDEQSLQQSLSTFSAHIKNIAEALSHLRNGALVLFDEIGAGTDPAEGAALAKSILLTLKEQGAYVVASTHYGELKAFAYNTPGFRNAAMEFDAKSLRPTYRVLMDAPGASHALKIAERYGLPKAVVERAVQGLSEEEQQITKMLEQLELAQRRARIAQGEADRRVNEAKKAEEVAKQKLAEADEIRKNVHARAAETIDNALRDIRAEAAEIFEELKNSPVDQRQHAKARERLKGLQSAGATSAKQFEAPPSRAPNPGSELARGMSVKVEGYSQPGVVLDDPKGGQVFVQLGSLKLTVKTSLVTPAQKKSEMTQKSKPNANLQHSINASTEIHLRAMRAEDAQRDLEKFIDDAVLAGLPWVRIVHGKGEGILRKLTQDFLRRHAHIERFRPGEPPEGGDGVTVAYIR